MSVPHADSVVERDRGVTMPPEYGSVESSGDAMQSLISRSHDEEELLIQLMRKRAIKYFIPKRCIFSLLSFMACCLAVSYNINLSITIVSMLDEKVETNETESLKSDVLNKTEINKQMMKLHWGADIESFALGAVYYGQLVSFIPGGRMAELYGGKRMLLTCMLVAAVATLLSPLTASLSPYAFIANRVLIGIGTGPIIPIVFYMLARWIPESERSFHASFILSGYGVGSFLAVIVSGALCGTTFLNGWPSVFYIGGAFGLLWLLLCAYMMCENPDQHPGISDEEYTLIMSGKGSGKKQKILKVPWKQMVFSVPLWALAIGFFGQFWLLGFFSTVHALYMGKVLDLPIVKNGLLSCLPHLLRAFATCLASYPVDIMLKRRVVTVGFIRKGATLINSLVSCGAFFGITLVGRNVTATTFLFILGGIFGEFVTFGVCMACIDIAPSLSGTVSGLVNIVGVFPFFIIPALVGWITNYENSIEEWQKVFYASIAVVLVSTLIFIIFGDLTPQPWGTAPDLKTKTEEKDDEKLSESENEITSPKIVHDIY